MKLAWAASMAGQTILLVSLVRSGHVKDYWTAYLGLDLMRSIAMWQMAPGPINWWTWLIGEVVLAVPQFASVASAVARVQPRSVVHIGVIAGASCAVHLMLATSSAWPLALRAGLMIHQLVAFGCFGTLAAPVVYLGRSSDNWPLLMYYSIRAAHAAVAQVTMLSSTWNALYLWVLAGLFVTTAFQRREGGFCQN